MSGRKSIHVLGCTGSIGCQTLEVARHLGFSVVSLAARSNVKRIERQARVFGVKIAALEDQQAARDLKTRLRDTAVTVLSGSEGLCEAAQAEADLALSAMVGMAGLKPTLAALDAGRPVALANKETLVCAGALVMVRARAKHVPILPVDSEHSAIFQCLAGHRSGQIARILLTASGGPFRGYTKRSLAGVTPAQALRHPNWSMGTKVTVDSATLLNKGLELIEAMHLFGLPERKIEVLVHPQSIIHSMVTYTDGSTLAQLGSPDMRLPIQTALTWPERAPSLVPPPDFLSLPPLMFEPPDEENFRCLALARQAARRGGTAPVLLNAAGEIAVERFLAGRIGFLEIPALIERVLEMVPTQDDPTLEDILAADAIVRKEF